MPTQPTQPTTESMRGIWTATVGAGFGFGIWRNKNWGPAVWTIALGPWTFHRISQ